jgi:hypothetical protein
VDGGLIVRCCARALGIAAMLVASAAAGQQAPVVEPHSAPALLNESIVFFAGFDRSRASADLAVGRAEPLRVEGKLRFVPGRFGQALLLGAGGGGARLTYPAEGHLDFRRPGAFSFWVRPFDWRDATEASRGYVVFVHVPARRGGFVVERMGFDRAKRGPDRLIVGAFDLPQTKRLFVGFDGTESWDSHTWHLVVVNWDRHGFAVSLDGEPFVRRAEPRGFESEAFVDVKGPRSFRIGDLRSETSAIDELAIYALPLEAADAARLFGR